MGKEALIDLWRVCRTVSHEGRLKLLWLLFEHGEMCVSELKIASGMTKPNTSIQMKELFLAGLVRFRRQNMNVIYRAEADSRIPFAEILLALLKQCFEEKMLFEDVARQVTAFTHERRIEIVQALLAGPCPATQLPDRTGMKSSALFRHLSKLEARRIVRRDGKLYRVACPSEPLSRTLLDIVKKETA